jgi:hypothetical protein
MVAHERLGEADVFGRRVAGLRGHAALHGTAAHGQYRIAEQRLKARSLEQQEQFSEFVFAGFHFLVVFSFLVVHKLLSAETWRKGRRQVLQKRVQARRFFLPCSENNGPQKALFGLFFVFLHHENVQKH